MLAKEKLDKSLKSSVVDTSSSLERYAYLPAVSQPLPPIPTSKVQVKSVLYCNRFLRSRVISLDQIRRHENMSS